MTRTRTRPPVARPISRLFLLVAGVMPAAARALPVEPTTTISTTVPGLPAGGDARYRAHMFDWEAPVAAPSPATAPSMIAPVPHMRLSSGFGYRRDPLLGVGAEHLGIDIPDPVGAGVYASADGVVIRAGTAGGYGGMIAVDHGDGTETRYAHLSRLLVARGAIVRQGERIGLVGSTGRSTGSHLHYEVRVDGRAIDPIAFLDATPLAGAPTAAAAFRSRFSLDTALAPRAHAAIAAPPARAAMSGGQAMFGSQ